MNEFETLQIGSTVYTVADAEARRLAKKTLNILSFGNSFQVDCLLYLPLLLKEALPDAEINLGMCFESGCTMAQHLTMLQNSTAYENYYEWTEERGKYLTYARDSYHITAAAALARRDWDVIILHQTANTGSGNQTDYTSLKGFADGLLALLDKPAALLIDIPHTESPGKSGYSEQGARTDFAAFALYAKTALEDYPYFSGVLPTGTAVENLRYATGSSAIGNTGWLTYDNSHLQVGLGMLCAGYAACSGILEALGEKPKTHGYQFAPTNDTATTINFSGFGKEYGVCGISDANRALAQKCAMMARKEPFTITAMTSL